MQEQGIQNSQQIMAVVVNSSSSDNDMYERLQKTREDTALLVNDSHGQFMQMEDQDGNAIHLPPDERNSLMTALAFHEKGKAALKREVYSEALIYLLEADNEYKNCRSSLLGSVDNYALLNLDIAWCYLCLRVSI